MANGYWAVYAPKHPDSYRSGWILEHRFLMGRKMGRRLSKKEIVHHINGDRSDNCLLNLELLKSKGAHQVLHWKKMDPKKRRLLIKRLSNKALEKFKSLSKKDQIAFMKRTAWSNFKTKHDK